eukprot:377455-Rhodomonas_salina.1
MGAESRSAASSSGDQLGRVVSRHARRAQMSLTVLSHTPKRRASSRGTGVWSRGQREGREA